MHPFARGDLFGKKKILMFEYGYFNYAYQQDCEYFFVHISYGCLVVTHGTSI